MLVGVVAYLLAKVLESTHGGVQRSLAVGVVVVVVIYGSVIHGLRKFFVTVAQNKCKISYCVGSVVVVYKPVFRIGFRQVSRACHHVTFIYFDCYVVVCHVADKGIAHVVVGGRAVVVVFYVAQYGVKIAEVDAVFRPAEAVFDVGKRNGVGNFHGNFLVGKPFLHRHGQNVAVFPLDGVGNGVSFRLHAVHGNFSPTFAVRVGNALVGGGNDGVFGVFPVSVGVQVKLHRFETV